MTSPYFTNHRDTETQSLVRFLCVSEPLWFVASEKPERDRYG